MKNRIAKILEKQLLLTQDEFIIKVETYVHRDNDRYLDAIIQVCDDMGVDYVEIIPLITGPIKEKLKLESEQYRLIKQPQHNTASLYD
jgi:MoaA/NifB/PqqE/SkfB family radical SAM enzyme